MVHYTQMSLKELEPRVCQMEIKYGLHQTRFGKCQIGLCNYKVCHVSFGDGNYCKESMVPIWQNANFIQAQNLTKKILQDILDDKTDDIEVLGVGSDFQHEVWKALLKIPHGKTVYYEQVAEMIGKPKAVRAVATAIGQNNIAFIIPCHRVISKTGKLNNYRWGTDKKKDMLIYENADIVKSF